MTKEQFLIKCESDGFDYCQMEQVRLGLNYDLSIARMSMFAKKEFNDMQMWQIRFAAQEGLTLEQLSLLSKPELTWEQIYDIRYMFKDGEPFAKVREQVALMILES